LHFGWIYKSVDGGEHWTMFDRAGLGTVTFRTITFDLSDSDPQLYGLALLRGVFAYRELALKTQENVTPRPHAPLN
jgi:hypothetical protein